MNIYCSNPDNQSQTIWCLMGKMTSDISRGMSITKDQTCFLLGGGVLKRSSYGTPMKCSISTVPLRLTAESEANNNHNPGNESTHSENNLNTFTWINIQRKYKARSTDLDSMNLYTFSALCWKPGKRIITQFYGYYDKALWPLDEPYSKWKLTLFKPWRVSVHDLKQGRADFSKALSIYMFDKMFPPRICTANGQKLLVFHHLYYQCQLFLFNFGQLQIRPPSQFVYVEGLPGIGKTFVINTIWKMTRIIHITNKADLASAST
jgi:hypothetical protein